MATTTTPRPTVQIASAFQPLRPASFSLSPIKTKRSPSNRLPSHLAKEMVGNLRLTTATLTG